MDIAALRAFVAVCEAGSISGASRRLYIGQPALTRRIASLERAVGCPLLERHARGVALTPGGARFLESALRALTAYDELLAQEREDMGARALRPLRLGLLDEGLGAQTLPLAHAFGQARPDCEIVLVPVRRPDRRHVLEDRSDIDVLAGVDPAPSSGDVRSRDLYCSERVAAVPRNDELAAADVLTVGDLVDRSFASLAAVPAGLRSVHALELERGGPARYSPHACAPEIPSLLSRVAEGDVMTFGSGVVGCFRHPDVVYRRVADAAPIPTRLAWRVDGHPAAEALVRIAATICGDVSGRAAERSGSAFGGALEPSTAS